MSAWSELRRNWWGLLVGITLTCVLGYALLTTVLGQKFAQSSYDLLFPMRWIVKPTEVVMVYLDEASHTELGQPYHKPWDRALHAQLLRRLTADGAKAVVFDIVFYGASSNPQSDALLAEAIKENGSVILAADYVPAGYGSAFASGQKFDPPHDIFWENYEELGSAGVIADDDMMIREYLPSNKDDPIAGEGWAVAAKLGLPATKNTKLKHDGFWINYYGPRDAIPGISFYKAIDENDPEVPPDFFQGKVVFVGAKFFTKYSGERKDEFPNPFSRWVKDSKFIGGVDVQATAFLNLLRSEWLTRYPYQTQRAIILLAGLLFGAGLVMLRPTRAAAVAIVGASLVTWVSYLLFVKQHHWFPWLIIVAAQIPIALFWSILYNSVRLYVQKRLLEQSLERHLSPKRVKQLVHRNELVKPGAEKQMLTILFSDIENFTQLSEDVDSDELARLMNNYFETAVSKCIFKTDGTVVKYIGDAIFSFWNAPEDQADHAIRACEAALLLSEQAIVRTANGETMRCRTRVGLHTGVANVGNFGSATRIDYTAIGENINLASRMEGLNKYLNTSVLITNETKAGIGEQFVTRHCGKFRLKGFERAVEVFELVGKAETADSSKAWREAFAEALKLYQEKQFDRAETGFRCVLKLRPKDGPSNFYLQQIEEMKSQTLIPGWHGETELRDK